MALTSSDDRLRVTTPELVTFDYRLAGLGSRFVAQLIDLVVVILIFGAVAVAAIVVAVNGSGAAALLIAVIGAFVILFGYFWFSEAAWSGLTVGKFALGLRTVDDRGGPISFTQSAIRNLIRILDFLPVAYGLAITVMLVAGPGKRLGDFAAGTVVIREGGVAAAPGATTASLPPSPAPLPARLDPAHLALLRSLDPGLRRFVAAYAERAPSLDPATRAHLAMVAGTRLQAVMPALAASHGPLAVLDYLAMLVATDTGR